MKKYATRKSQESDIQGFWKSQESDWLDSQIPRLGSLEISWQKNFPSAKHDFLPLIYWSPKCPPKKDLSKGVLDGAGAQKFSMQCRDFCLSPESELRGHFPLHWKQQSMRAPGEFDPLANLFETLWEGGGWREVPATVVQKIWCLNCKKYPPKP